MPGGVLVKYLEGWIANPAKEKYLEKIEFSSLIGIVLLNVGSGHAKYVSQKDLTSRT